MSKRILLATAVTIIFLTIPAPSYPYQADVQDISQDKYFQAALDAMLTEHSIG